MRFVLLSTLTLLWAGPLFAQGPQAEAPSNNPAAMSKQQWGSQQALPEGKPSPTEAEVTPDTPVVTLEGICDEPRATGTKVCKTVITRAQMDSLIDMVSPGALPAARSARAPEISGGSGMMVIAPLSKESALQSKFGQVVSARPPVWRCCLIISLSKFTEK